MSDGTTTYAWDARDRLVALAGPGLTADFAYDAQRRRDFFLTADALGSTLAVSDASSGTAVSEHTYDPFGVTTATNPAFPNPFQFTGRENDGTGLYYYRARYYHPGLQRFISEDPIGFAGGNTNLYAYVQNNPLSFGDPFGLCRDPGGSGIRYCIDAYIHSARDRTSTRQGGLAGSRGQR